MDFTLDNLEERFTLYLQNGIILKPISIDQGWSGNLQIRYGKIPKNIPIEKLLKNRIQIYGKKFFVEMDKEGMYLEEDALTTTVTLNTTNSWTYIPTILGNYEYRRIDENFFSTPFNR